jgi:hypothetical protein
VKGGGERYISTVQCVICLIMTERKQIGKGRSEISFRLPPLRHPPSALPPFDSPARERRLVVGWRLSKSIAYHVGSLDRNIV